MGAVIVSDGQTMSDLGARPVDRSMTKPVWMIVAKDATTKLKFQYYLASNVTEGTAAIEFRGWLLEKAQADQLTNNPSAKCLGIEVNRKIPWNNIERIDNLTYKKIKKESL